VLNSKTNNYFLGDRDRL